MAGNAPVLLAPLRSWHVSLAANRLRTKHNGETANTVSKGAAGYVSGGSVKFKWGFLVHGSWFLVRASRVGYRQVLSRVRPWCAAPLDGSDERAHDAPQEGTRPTYNSGPKNDARARQTPICGTAGREQ
jgi:hypothetical protein